MEMRACPKCRAEGTLVEMVIKDGYAVCNRCETTWNARENGEMVALPEEI